MESTLKKIMMECTWNRSGVDLAKNYGGVELEWSRPRKNQDGVELDWSRSKKNYGGVELDWSRPKKIMMEWSWSGVDLADKDKEMSSALLPIFENIL